MLLDGIPKIIGFLIILVIGFIIASAVSDQTQTVTQSVASATPGRDMNGHTNELDVENRPRS